MSDERRKSDDANKLLWAIALSPLLYLVASVVAATMGEDGRDLLVTGFVVWLVVQVGATLRDALNLGGVASRPRAIAGVVVTPLYLGQRPLLRGHDRTKLKWTWIVLVVAAN